MQLASLAMLNETFSVIFKHSAVTENQISEVTYKINDGLEEQDKKAHQAHQAHRAHQVVFENYIFFGALFYLFRKR